ncbi:hypothetical protein DFJ77DRAFT_294451 [Powellomyces hirtus]|nr:hypothetical protein DFJ77DRAFT_294451 [Powellomyces hirtus]
MDTKQVKSLSTGTMALKFMNRAQEQEVRKKLEEEQKRAQEEAKWILGDLDLDDVDTVEFQFDNSHIPFLDSTFGRKSFGNFNKEVETMSEEARNAERLRIAEENEKRESVSDFEMVNRYHQIRGEATPVEGAKRKRRAAATDSPTSRLSAASNSEPPSKKRSPAAPVTTDWNDLRGRQATRFMSLAPTSSETPPAQRGFIKPQ